MADAHFDVAVVGGGAGGLAAAAAAARCGARTLLVERYGFLGGAASNAQVLSYCGFYKQGTAGPEPAVAGIGEELLAGLRSLGMDTTPLRARSGNWIVMLDTEAVKLAFDRLALGAGVHLRLHSLLVQAHCEDGRLAQLTLGDHQGLHRIRAHAFVDASGEADLARLAGVAMGMDAGTGAHAQPASLPIRIGGIPAGTAIDRARLGALIADYNQRRGAAAGLTRPDGGVLARLPLSGDLWTMVVDIATDGVSAGDLTRAETRSRALAWDFVQLLRQLPGCAQAYLAATGPQLGVRESRRPRAVDDVTADDAAAGRLRPEDGIARGCWPMEVHEAPGRVRFTPIGGGGHFDIGHAALLARGVPNLRLAGRVIGADAQTYGSIRVMGTAFATGQAAGVSAALHASGPPPAAAAVRQALLRQGALL
ncbi:FAD-dependent oxidoreductase [Pseudorhodoferax sp.]|uniref:FAD-dependent oxidoreductase n=1 Tax=Pseudorhodoferax sp. TaxID=1993553 RepID=UPI0039E2AA06